MSFFEPPPPPPKPIQRQWSAPAWDRPSEGTLPWMVPINGIVHQNVDVVVFIESIAVYPNGFVINVGIRASPRQPEQEIMTRIHRPGARIPRVGVRFSDGRMAGREAHQGQWVRPTPEHPRDAEGFPINPIMRGTGGGGGGGGWRFGVWVYPLPPEGPIEIFVSLPAAGLDEGKTLIDGKVIRDASQKATVVWS